MGSSVSTVSCLNSDDWNETSLGYLEFGGNNGFSQIINKYSLPESPALLKYQTKAAHHYRLQLDSIVNKIPIEDPSPSLEEGKEIVPIVPGIPYMLLYP